VPLNSRAIVFLFLGALILGLGPLAKSMPRPASASLDHAALPSIPNCQSLRGWSTEWSPTFIGADYTLRGSFQCDGYRLHVNVVQYVDQHQGKEAVGEFNRIVPRLWWNATTRRSSSAGSDLQVDEYQVERGASRLTIWTWYAVGTHATKSELGTKTLEAVNAILFRSRPTSNLSVAVEAPREFSVSGVLPSDAGEIWDWFRGEMRTQG
jgi:EpsI family protein